MDQSMNGDCFNMAVRILACDELHMLRDTPVHYMDMTFCTVSDFARDPRRHGKLDVQRLAQLFHSSIFNGWHNISKCKLYMLFVLDQDAKTVFILDSLSIPARCKDNPVMSALFGYFIFNFMRSWNGEALQPPVCRKRFNTPHNRMGKPQFLKVLFMDFMEKMPIPTKFMQRHLAAEPGRQATLLSPLGKFWHVNVARDGDDGVYFAGGWTEFVRANKLEEENFLVFRYEGNMVFTVKVFETSDCIKDYGDVVLGVADAGTATAAAASLEKTAPKHRSDGTGCGSQPTSMIHRGMLAHKSRKISERKLAGDDDIQPKKQCGCHRIWIGENDDDQDATPEKYTQADDVATGAKEPGYTGTHPVYVKAATPCNLRYGYMNIGKKFCTANGLASNRLMILRDPGGRSWPVKVKLTLTSDQARMKAGWGHFSGHHGIKVGDLCVFHLVDQHTFNVSIRRAA